MGSKGSNKVSTQSTQTSAPDPRVQQAGYQALSGAQSAAQLPFQMPQAPVAGFSPLQQQYFNQIQGGQGMALPYFDEAAQAMRGSASPISEQDVSQYYNPFAANVFANLQDVFGQQMHQTTGNAVQQAGGTGADRIGVTQANLAKQQGLAAGQTAASLYQPALQAAQQQKQMMAGEGFGLGQLGPAAQASFFQGTGLLGQAGAQQQALQQAQLNAPYQQQLAQIAFPYQQPQYLAGITGSLAPAMGGTTSGQSQTTYPQPSPLNQILGLGTAGLGAYMGIPGLGGGGSMKGSMPNAYSSYGSPSGGWGYMGVPYPTFRRGGRLFASGGAAYGDLAGQRFANSPVGNPYAHDDSDKDSDNYADGGDVPPPLPGSAPPPMDTTSIVPKVPLGGGGSHFPTLDLRHQPLRQAPSVAGDIASGLRTATKMMSAQGGAVNPFDAGQPFANGGTPFEDRFSGDVDQLPEMINPIQGETPGSALAGSLKAQAEPAFRRMTAPGQTDEGLPRQDITTEVSGTRRNPFVTANRDMTLDVTSPQRPYPDALKRDWGQNLTRNPWLALVDAGAKMAQTVGPVGSAIGAGIGAGSKTLQGQRQELQSEEQLNQKADALFQHAKTHLDQYQRMTPYEQATSDWRQTAAQAKADAPTAMIKNAKWLVDNGVAPDLATAQKMVSSGVNQPAVMERAIRAEKANIAKTPEGSGLNDQQLEALARRNVQERFDAYRPAGAKPTSPAIGEKRVFKDRAGNDVTGVWDGTEWKPETT